MSDKKNNKEVVSAYKIPLYVGLAVVIGMLFGMFVSNHKIPTNDTQRKIEKISQVLYSINQDYVDSLGLDSLTDKGITAMLAMLDPHTVYIPATESVMHNASLQKGFEGIGVEFRIIQDTLMVIKVLKNGPSQKAGLLSGDKIISVDDSPIIGIDLPIIYNLLRGAKGNSVEVKIKRGNEFFIKKIIRDKISTYAIIASHMLDSTTAYIKLRRFAQGAADEVRSSIIKLKKQGMKSLLLDLRGNGGGFLHEVIAISEDLLPHKSLILYTKGKRKQFNNLYNVEKEKGVFSTGKLAILIDESSASASEVLAGAIQDNDRGIIVGRRSFGKGLVQETKKFSDGSEIKITISRYYTPSGRCIQKPYKDSAYFMDYYNRFINGEFQIEDSVSYNDTLVYRTKKGRIVYGGGGIYPDIFIPQDTNHYTILLGKIYTEQIFNDFIPSLYLKYKDSLSLLSFSDFNQNFQINQSDLFALKKHTKNRLSETYSETDFNTSLPRIKLELKALLARLYWDDNEYYQIINQRDKTVIQTIKELHNI